MGHQIGFLFHSSPLVTLRTSCVLVVDLDTMLVPFSRSALDSAPPSSGFLRYENFPSMRSFEHQRSLRDTHDWDIDAAVMFGTSHQPFVVCMPVSDALQRGNRSPKCSAKYRFPSACVRVCLVGFGTSHRLLVTHTVAARTLGLYETVFLAFLHADTRLLLAVDARDRR
ncbi:hypothetical protein EXIGLDRAFT_771497 [Exidia glandulosa HHB12029]|uniref:FCP1 homology domain-containing protein n=1 Tax=Exidia glandulosa HHB12029 TaxID=1314781 RepID=A0A166A9B5_EXIGL|nr:hypothetical protein EXIGLDRAFT_771497 [Exidia glandulosa HHB12029]